jgi:hypothetical protein
MGLHSHGPRTLLSAFPSSKRQPGRSAGATRPSTGELTVRQCIMPSCALLSPLRFSFIAFGYRKQSFFVSNQRDLVRGLACNSSKLAQTLSLLETARHRRTLPWPTMWVLEPLMPLILVKGRERLPSTSFVFTSTRSPFSGTECSNPQPRSAKAVITLPATGT